MLYQNQENVIKGHIVPRYLDMSILSLYFLKSHSSECLLNQMLFPFPLKSSNDLFSQEMSKNSRQGFFVPRELTLQVQRDNMLDKECYVPIQATEQRRAFHHRKHD